MFDDQRKSKDATITSKRALSKEKTIDGAFLEQYGVTYSNIILVLRNGEATPDYANFISYR